MTQIRQIGASVTCLPNMGLSAAIGKAKGTGFSRAVILGFEGHRHSQGELAGIWFGSAPGQAKQALRRQLSGFVALSFHAHFTNLPIMSPDPRVACLAGQRIEEWFDACAFFGARRSLLYGPLQSQGQERTAPA